MKRKQPNDEWPVLLSELVDERFAETAGQLLDRLYAEGAQVGMNPRGLAVRQATAGRLRAERREAERIAREEFEKAETERLQRQEEQQKLREVEQEAAARDQAFRERVSRLERALGVPVWQLESIVRRSRTHAPGTVMTVDGLRAETDRTITIDELEQYVRDTYGPEILDVGRVR